jgi:hypothetical protein
VAAFRQGLVRAIDEAGSIVVTEHSYETDIASESGSSLTVPLVYERRRLSATQRARLRELAAGLTRAESGFATYLRSSRTTRSSSTSAAALPARWTSASSATTSSGPGRAERRRHWPALARAVRRAVP